MVPVSPSTRGGAVFEEDAAEAAQVAAARETGAIRWERTLKSPWDRHFCLLADKNVCPTCAGKYSTAP
jgi:hypothetical protein